MNLQLLGNSMKRYFNVYKKLLQLNYHALIVYRGNFVNTVVSSVSWGIFSIVSMVLLTSKTSSIFGWTREEILILTGSYSIAIGLFHMIFSRNFDRFSRIVNLGQLDSILVKPIDAQFLLSFWIINYASFFRIILGIVFTAIMIKNVGLMVDISRIIIFTLLALVGLVLLYSIWFFVIVFTLWSTRLSNLVDLMFTVSGISRYPPEMLRQLSFFVFAFFLPLTLIISTPTKVLLHRANFWDVLFLLLFSVIFLFVARKFWKFALRFYTSASS